MTLRDFESKNLAFFQHGARSSARTRHAGPGGPASKGALDARDILTITGSNPSSAAATAVTQASITAGTAGTYNLSGVNTDGEKYSVLRLTVNGALIEIDMYGKVGSLAAVTDNEIAGLLNIHPVFSKLAIADSVADAVRIRTLGVGTAMSIIVSDFGANDKLTFSTTEVNGTGTVVTAELTIVDGRGYNYNGPIWVYGRDATTGTTLNANAKMMVAKGGVLQGEGTNSVLAVVQNGSLNIAVATQNTADHIYLDFDSYPEAGAAFNEPASRIDVELT